MPKRTDLDILLSVTARFPKLNEFKPGLAQEHLRLIRCYAPTVASEPLLLGPLLSDVLLAGHITPSLMKKICALEIDMYNAAGSASDVVKFADMLSLCIGIMDESQIKELIRSGAQSLNVSEDAAQVILDNAEQTASEKAHLHPR